MIEENSNFTYALLGIIGALVTALGKFYADRSKYKQETELNERDLWVKLSEQQNMLVEQYKENPCGKCKLEERVAELEKLAAKLADRYERRKTKG